MFVSVSRVECEPIINLLRKNTSEQTTEKRNPSRLVRKANRYQIAMLDRAEKEITDLKVNIALVIN